MNIKGTLESLNIDIGSIADESIRSIIIRLSNLIEVLSTQNKQLTEENQALRDEINRLKGEQGKPDIRKQSKDKKDISSEKDREPRGKQGKKKKTSKKTKLTITRTERRTIPLDELPPDAIFKGYETTIIQDIIITTENIAFEKAKYYSPSLKKTFMADLPTGYTGDYGPNIRALVLDLHHNGKMTESAILVFLTNHGVRISAASISRLITDKHDVFHQEKQDIVKAGLASAVCQQMDDTSARVAGKNHYTHILCNVFYTAFFTRKRKDRLTILDILTTTGEMMFCFDEDTDVLMEDMKLSKKAHQALTNAKPCELLNRAQVDALLAELFPNPKKHKASRRIILEASAIRAYRRLPESIKLLLVDDAPQYKQITELLALCWVHDARHYKKLDPQMTWTQNKLQAFMDSYWNYYHALLDYKQAPTAELAETLFVQFDAIFATKTGYDQLDKRIEKTRLKKAELLRVLSHPDTPLHNNGSELGARTQARYRDISFHNMSQKGVEGKDTFMTISETAKKLAVNGYYYFLDRITGNNTMTSLADLISAKSQPPPQPTD